MTDQTPAETISLTKRALSAHHILGISISAVLYIICFSGMVSVFKDEIQLWEQGAVPNVASLTAANAQTAALNGIAADPKTKHLYIHLPTEQYQRAIVQTDNREIYVDTKGQLAGDVAHPWSDFLIDLHYYLHLPTSFGMIVVAIFGVFLFAMSLTGLFAHPNIFKDAFAFRKSKSDQLKHVDLHNRLAVWTAPFHISNSLTGAMLGLAAFSALAVGTLKYDGDTGKVFEPVFGAEPSAIETPAPLANIEKALLYVQTNHADTIPIFAIVHDPGTKGQYLQIMAEHPRRLIYAEKYNFDREGRFIDTVGSADGHMGQQVADSVYKIHFGAFGGLPVKIAFVIFGICLLYIIHAGMKIYFIKQAAKGKASAAFQRAWAAIIWAVPALLIITLIASQIFPISLGWLTLIFWGGLCTSLTIAFMSKAQRPKTVNAP